MSTHAPRMTWINPPSGWQALNLGELWAYREMIWRLTLRDIKSRYKQSILGPAWVIIIPLVQALLFTLIFGNLAGISTGETPTIIFMFTGILIWTLFSRGFSQTGGSIANNQNLITKVYFPRLVAPIAAAGGAVLDFAIGLVVLVVLMAVTQTTPSWNVVFVPVFIALALITSVSLGIWVAVASVRFRDFRYSTSFIVQVMMWLSAVPWPSSLLLGQERFTPWLQTTLDALMRLNPVFVVVDGFRWSVYGNPEGRPTLWTAVSIVLTMISLFAGLMVFRRIDATVADTI